MHQDRQCPTDPTRRKYGCRYCGKTSHMTIYCPLRTCEHCKTRGLTPHIGHTQYECMDYAMSPSVDPVTIERKRKIKEFCLEETRIKITEEKLAKEEAEEAAAQAAKDLVKFNKEAARAAKDQATSAAKASKNE